MKRKGPKKSFIKDAAVLSGSDDDEDEEEEEDNNECFRDYLWLTTVHKRRRTKPICPVVVRTTI